jgi:cell division septum initiation protein DivIVA
MDTSLDPNSLDPNKTNPRDALLDRADEKLADAYEQFTRAGEEVARAEQRLSQLEREAARAAAARKQPSLGGRAARGLTGLVLAACVFAGAIVSQSSYGNTAKQIVASWAPRLVATASLPLNGAALPAQLSPHIAQAAAEQTAPPQPAPPPQSPPQDAAPTAASPSGELTQLLQSMARDLATLGQGIEELKTRQEQLARDNAGAVEQLRASQDQMARAIATLSEARAAQGKTSEGKTSETRTLDARASVQNARPKPAAPPLRQTATPAHRAAPAHPSPQATRP